MKLICMIHSGLGRSVTVATDMDEVSFIKYAKLNYSHDVIITHVVDLTEGDYNRWIAEGLPSVTKQQLRLMNVVGARA